MNIQTGTVLHGFKTTNIRKSAELNGELIEMEHIKTGAQLVFMNNGENNKLFCVAFKTLPEDSTGVFHILEHSVLCGSEKYPVKEPFVDLLKSSMNTFLNAMTYPDKTAYPVSSRNDRDFLNLMSVYLDAVFAPALLNDPNIFCQEGHHTEVNDGVPSYKGVVFNEMKGATSGVNDKIEYEINRLLFPDNCYRFNSGGDPAVIPDLTYENYVAAYKKYYHPSNSRFFLDGDVPVDETLEMINSYLEKYEKLDIDFDVEYQTPVSAEDTAYYEIGADEECENKAVLSFGKIICSWKDRTRLTAVKILCDVLADSNESPLKRAVLSSGLAEDFDLSVMDCIAQPYLLMVVRNTRDEHCGEIRRLIRTTAEKLVADGLDKQQLTASINRFAFNAKQISEPQGLFRALYSYNSWLYGGDPMQYIVFDDVIAELRVMAENGGFDKLLSDLLCNDECFAVLHMLPSHTLGEEQRRAEEKRVSAEYEAMTENEKTLLEKRNELLEAWQKTPDSPENSAKLPSLDKSCVDPKPENINTEVTQENGITVFRHDISTHGIVYLSMYFSLAEFNYDELSLLPVFASLFGELPTTKRTVAELQQDIKSNIGLLSFETDVFSKDSQTEKCIPCLIVRAGILKENIEKAKEIITDVILNTKFSDLSKIREIVLQNDEITRQNAAYSGHAIALSASRAHYCARAAVNEAFTGYTFIKSQHELAKDFENKGKSFISLCEKAQASVFCRSGLTVGITDDEKTDFSDIFSLLPEGNVTEKEKHYETILPKKLGIRIPAQVSFASKAFSLSDCGMNRSGSLRVASNIISLGYLWNLVRVQGGAYGAGFPVSRDGVFSCYSYRDPSPSSTLGIYDGISDYIKEFCESDEDLNKYIISAVALTEPLRTPFEKGCVADEFQLSGSSYDDRVKIRTEMLSTDRDSLLYWCEAAEKMAENGAVCVLGNDEALSKCDSLTIVEM